jgi:Zn-dependent membrane protease YugP
MNLEITTPALLFPAISLLLLAYTSRFLATGQLIRGLSANARTGEVPKASKQIKNLKRRVELIKLMQVLGVLSLFLCTLSMFLLFIKQSLIGNIIFGISLLFMCASLITALIEITISTNAIDIELQGIKKNNKVHKCKKDEICDDDEEEINEQDS